MICGVDVFQCKSLCFRGLWVVVYMGRRTVYSPKEEEIVSVRDESIERFTKSVEVEPDASLLTRTYRIESTKSTSSVVQEMKSRFSDEFNLPYNQLKGLCLNRDGDELLVTIIPKTWEDE